MTPCYFMSARMLEFIFKIRLQLLVHVANFRIGNFTIIF